MILESVDLRRHDALLPQCLAELCDRLVLYVSYLLSHRALHLDGNALPEQRQERHWVFARGAPAEDRNHPSAILPAASHPAASHNFRRTSMLNSRSKPEPRGNPVGDDIAWRSRQDQNVRAIVESRAMRLASSNGLASWARAKEPEQTRFRQMAREQIGEATLNRIGAGPSAPIRPAPARSSLAGGPRRRPKVCCPDFHGPGRAG